MEQPQIPMIYVDQEELAEYIWRKLLDYGFVPEIEEVYTITDVVFDYLEEKGMPMDELEGDED